VDVDFDVAVALFVDDLLMFDVVHDPLHSTYRYRICKTLLLNLCCNSQQLQQSTLICLYLSGTDRSVSTISCGIVPVPGTDRASEITLHAPASTLTLFRFCFTLSLLNHSLSVPEAS
jgi:hypothetical protein